MKFILSVSLILVCSGFLFGQTNPHGNLKIECLVCHETTTWQKMKKNSRFDHFYETDYKIEGAHKNLDCSSCHKNLVFSEVKNTCSGCHTDVHNFVFGNFCSDCHTQTKWRMTNKFGFHDRTNFVLRGSHTISDCNLCHKLSEQGIFTGLSNDCFSCHKTDYENTKNPNHAASGFGTDCKNCHTTQKRNWQATFAHNQFPLTGVHKSILCENCHLNGNYTNASSDCFSCHKTDYENTNNPNHAASGFGTDCKNCHNTTNFGWKPATFEHNQFSLTGVHKSILCENCHLNGNYTNASSDCFSCHKTDYENTNNPNHAASGFGTDCKNCHNTTNFGWKPATFEHDSKFPIFSGKHKNVWSSCQTCHANQNNYKEFSCFAGCHEHNKSKMDSEHDEVSGYVYDSVNCYNCHPTGKD